MIEVKRFGDSFDIFNDFSNVEVYVLCLVIFVVGLFLRCYVVNYFLVSLI